VENSSSKNRCFPQKVADTSKKSPYYPVLFSTKSGIDLAVLDFEDGKLVAVDQIALEVQDDARARKMIFGAHVQQR